MNADEANQQELEHEEIVSRSFKDLNELDVRKHIEKKGDFDYLAWAHCHEQLALRDPHYIYRVHDFPADSEGVIQYPYLATPAGCFVRVTVHFNGKEWTETLPILNFNNKSIDKEALNAMDVNTAIKRCFVKAAAHHGIGLYIYLGQQAPSEPDVTDVPAHQVAVIGGKYDGFLLGEIATKAGLAGMGYLYWMSRSHQSELMKAKALEVWLAHKKPYTDHEVTDLMADTTTVDELNGLYRMLTEEQVTTFKDQFTAMKEEFKSAQPTRTAEDARG